MKNLKELLNLKILLEGHKWEPMSRKPFDDEELKTIDKRTKVRFNSYFNRPVSGPGINLLTDLNPFCFGHYVFHTAEKKKRDVVMLHYAHGFHFQNADIKGTTVLRIVKNQ